MAKMASSLARKDLGGGNGREQDFRSLFRLYLTLVLLQYRAY